MGDSRPRFARLGLVLLLVGACAPMLGFDLLDWDDPQHLTRNPLVIAPEDASVWDQLTTPALGYPIPVTVALYRLEHALWGFTASGFHGLNALLHVANVLLAFQLARSLRLSTSAAVLAALAFGLHPASAECASWVTGLKDLLACAFGLSALLLSARPDIRFRLVSVACFGLGLLSKPSVAPLLVLFPVMGALQGSEAQTGRIPMPKRLRQALWSALPYMALLLPSMVLGILGQRAVGADMESFAPMSRARAVWYAFGHHAALVLFSEEPTARYAPSPWPPAFPTKADVAGLALPLAVAAALWFCRSERRRAAGFGSAFAALTYLPVSSLLFPLTRYLADTYVYLPLIGLGLVLGATFDEAHVRLPNLREAWFRAVPWLVGLALLPLFLVSSARFQSDFALWSHARERIPHHPRVCRQWANAAYKSQGAALGLAALDACIADFGPNLFEKNRGILLMQLGRTDEARVWLRAAARKSPSDPVIQRSLQELENAPPRR